MIENNGKCAVNRVLDTNIWRLAMDSKNRLNTKIFTWVCLSSNKQNKQPLLSNRYTYTEKFAPGSSKMSYSKQEQRQTSKHQKKKKHLVLYKVAFFKEKVLSGRCLRILTVLFLQRR